MVTARPAEPGAKLCAPKLTPDFLLPTAAAALFEACLHGLCWQQEQFVMFGKPVTARRLIAWAADPGVDYRYSGRSHPGIGWPECLLELRTMLESGEGRLFNHVIANRYRTGLDHLGWHRDDERGVCGAVAILSLGAARTFMYRYPEHGGVTRVLLESGSLMIFDGRIRHAIRRERDVRNECVSLTFRHVSQERDHRRAREPGMDRLCSLEHRV